MKCGFDLVYATVNAIVQLQDLHQHRTRLYGSSPTAVDAQVMVNLFAFLYNVHAVVRCRTILTGCLSGKEITTSSGKTVESDNSSASLLLSNADLNTSVTMFDERPIRCCLLV